MKKFFKKEKSRDGEKLKKQDGMSMIIVNYSDKIIRKFIPTLQQIIIILFCAYTVLSIITIYP